MSVKRRLFPAAFKRGAVERVVASGLSAGKVAVELGLHETVLRRWIKEAGTMAPGRPRRPGFQALAPLPSDLAAENARLRRENDRLRMEREILKKPSPSSGRPRDEVLLHPSPPDRLAHPDYVWGSGHLGAGSYPSPRPAAIMHGVRGPNAAALANRTLPGDIRLVHAQTGGCCGSPRVSASVSCPLPHPGA